MERIVWFPTDKADGFAVSKERIVRCKDCEFLAIDRWFGTDYFCSMLRMTIEPNGFCAWGEER